ncbi:MAG TPA: TonB-dependent receptor [Bacteroidia bacterium]|nr:TonB-dependent receptor [Bacteroidia bacterium]
MNKKFTQKHFVGFPPGARDNIKTILFNHYNRILWLLLLLPFYSAYCQNTATLSGKITDSKSSGISKASVYLLNTNLGTVTNDQGEFSIPGILPGNYTVQISAINYATATKNITLSSDKPESLNIPLNSSSRQLDEVVVTAQKKEEALQNIPVTITSLSSRQVQEYRLWDAKEISAIVPNLYAADPGDNRNVTSIRGITTTSYDPAVATYIDGVNQFGLDTYISQLFDVERIEILKGPQGTLYGRNAMGGVINIITKQPSNTLKGFAEVTLGDFKQQRFSAGVQAPIVKNKLFIGVAALYDSRDGFYTNEFTNSTFDKQHSISGNYYLKFIANSKWAVTLNAKHRNLRNNGAFTLNYLDPTNEAPLEFVLNQNATTQMIDDTYNGSLSVNYFGKGFNFTSQSAYQSNHHFYDKPIDADFSPLDGISLINNYDGWNKVQVVTQELKFTSPTASSSPLAWTAGIYLFYQDNPVKQAIHFGLDAPLLNPYYPSDVTSESTTESNSRGAALYGQATYTLSHKLDFTAGARFDYEKKKYSLSPPDTGASVNFNAFSPRIGLSYHLAETNMLFTAYSRGYRTGGLSTDPSQPPLYPYKPEHSGNIEAGIKNNFFGNRLHLNIAGFFTSVTDAQVPALVLPDAITVTRNAGKLESKGVEAEANVTPIKGLEASYSIGYTMAEYTKLNLPQDGAEVNLEGNKQIFTPDITSMLALQYSYDLGTKQQLRIVVRGEWMYLGKQYFDLANTISQEPYNLLNTRCGIAAKNFELMFWGRNLGDTKYISYSYDFGAVHLGNPRTLGVTLTGKF